MGDKLFAKIVQLGSNSNHSIVIDTYYDQMWISKNLSIKADHLLNWDIHMSP